MGILRDATSAAWAVYLYLLSFVLPSLLSLDVGLLALFILGGHAVLRLPCRIPVAVILPLVFFVSMVVMGNVVTTDPHRSLHLSLALLPAVVICLLVSGYFRDQDMVRLCYVLTAFVIGVGGWLTGMAVCHPSEQPAKWIEISCLTAFRVPNDIVIFQIFLPFPLVLWRLGPGRGAKWLALAAISIAMILAVLFRSRLALLVSGITVSLFYLELGEKRPLMKTLMLILGGAFLVDTLTGLHLTSKFSSLASASSRVPLWLAAWRMFLEAPWTGHGVGGFLSLYRYYLHPLPAGVVIDPRVTPWAHNIYLEVLAELGLGGLLAFLSLFVFPLKRWKDGRKMQEPEKVLNAAFVAAFAGFCASGVLELSLWRQWVGLTFLLLVGCMGWKNNQNREEK